MENTNKYIFPLFETHYLVNSQNYEDMKFYFIMVPYLVTKMSKIAQKGPNVPYVYRQRNIIFDPGDSHL